MYVLIAVLAAVLIALLAVYNSLVRLRNKVNEAFSTMDVFLKKRFDLIPALVEVVRGYAHHESDVLQQVASQRGGISQSDRSGQLAGEVKIGDALRTLFAVAEAYPELKADKQFLTLQEQLAHMEDEIALSRRYYNGSVREYNNQCQVFPLSLVAAAFGFRPMPMFAVSSNEERQTVNINI